MRQLTSRRATAAIATFWVLCAVCAAAAQTRTVWSGVYSESQAYRGEKIADTTCIGCHGPRLDGGDSGPKLVGDEFIANWSSQPVAVLFDWVREAMPPEAPGTLSRNDTAAVIAYILKLNKIPTGKEDLSTDPELLRQISIVDAPPR